MPKIPDPASRPRVKIKTTFLHAQKISCHYMVWDIKFKSLLCHFLNPHPIHLSYRYCNLFFFFF